MRRTLIAASVLVTVASIGWLVSTSRGASTEAAPPEGEHERIVRYWTPERVAHARPRDIVRDAPARPLGKGNSGGGGGSGTTSAVTGATWTGGGLVKEATGKVLFSMGGSNWVCSGAVATDGRAAESIVLTAGHCVYDDAANTFATNWMFVPDFQEGGTFTCSSTQYGCWTALALVTTEAWADRDFDEDYGFAIMGSGGKFGLTLEAAVGSYPLATDLARPRGEYAFGYPAAGKYSGGRTLTYCAGTEFGDPYGSTTYGVKCDMTGGSSGGPWLANFGAFDSTNSTANDVLTSVNSYGYSGGAYKGYMFGPRFDAYTAKTFAAANSLTVTAGPDDNKLVSP